MLQLRRHVQILVSMLKHGSKGLLQSQSGSPALEFALLAPVMLTLLMGSYDITQLLIAQHQVVATAQEIVEIATELAIQPDQTMSLTTNQAYQAQTAIYAQMPSLKSGLDTSRFSVTLSAVVFTATPAGCTAGANCTYIANTAWSTALPQGAQVTRPCGAITQVSPAQPATINNLRSAGITALTSALVVDVSYVYVPLFSGFLIGPETLQQTTFMPPRTGAPAAYVQYDIANAAADSSVCPGYL